MDQHLEKLVTYHLFMLLIHCQKANTLNSNWGNKNLTRGKWGVLFALSEGGNGLTPG